MKLYRQHFGTLPVKVGPSSTDLDIVAAITPDKTFITLAIINEKAETVQIAFDFGDSQIGDDGKQWLIQHDDLLAYNDPGSPPEVKIEASDISLINHQLEVQPYAIHLIKSGIE